MAKSTRRAFLGAAAATGVALSRTVYGTAQQDRPLKMGVIGVGWHGAGHLANFAANPKAELTAVCDINQELLAQRAEEYPGVRTFTDYHELLACDDVERRAESEPPSRSRRVLRLLRTARTHQRESRFVEAVQSLQTAHRGSPGDAGVLGELGWYSEIGVRTRWLLALRKAILSASATLVIQPVAVGLAVVMLWAGAADAARSWLTSSGDFQECRGCGKQSAFF